MSADQLLSELEHVAVIIMAVWGFWKIVMEIIKNINARHDKEQRWDDMVSKSEEEKKRRPRHLASSYGCPISGSRFSMSSPCS